MNKQNESGVKPKRGGVREGAGRKSRADEQLLVEKLSPLEPLAFAALTAGLSEGRDWAVKLFFSYKFGQPRQTIDQTNTHEINQVVWNETKSYTPDTKKNK